MTLQEAYQIINDVDEGTRTDRYYRQLAQTSPIPFHSAEELEEAWRIVNEDTEKRIQAEQDAMRERGFVEVDGQWMKIEGEGK